MSSTGYVLAGAGANVDRGGTSNVWATPGNVTADDGSTSSATVPTDYLVCSSFDFSSIPDGATIRGVTVRVQSHETGSGSSNYIPQLSSATTPTLIGSAKSAVTVSGTTPTDRDSGGTADTWSATLTSSVVKNSGFGVTLWSTDTTNVLLVDAVWIAIEYTGPFPGSGTPSVPLLTASGTGKKTRKGSGTPSLPLMTASGSGDVSSFVTFPGTGTPSLPLLTASGTGKKTRKGTGTPSLPVLTASGVGRRALRGSGTPSLPLLTAAGTGKKTRKGAGSPALPLLTAAGVGDTSTPVTWSGSGAPSLPLLTASGAGRRTLRGSGSPSLPILTASGVGRRTLRGSGAPSLPLLTAAGAARNLVLAGGGDGGTTRKMWGPAFASTLR